MDSQPTHSARPWTPPETEAHGSPESAYFSDPFRRASSGASDMGHRWPLKVSRPKPLHSVTEPAPYTPTKTSSLLEHCAPCALRYPYTPESSRILRSSTAGSLSSIPWDTDSRCSASPVQSALSSCIAHFENLTSMRELTDDQMEYIVGQFENMTSYLTAPDAQTKKATDDLFGGDSPYPESLMPRANVAGDDGSYMAEVGRYIEGVQIYTADLKRRFDEAKALNEIQLAIIDGLRKEMRVVQQSMQDPLDQSPQKQRRASSPSLKDVNSSWESIETAVDDAGDEGDLKVATPKPAMTDSSTQTEDVRRLVVARKPVKPTQCGFWASLYEALDSFSDDLHER